MQLLAKFAFLLLLLVATATLGSLFFSEVMELPPCSLCWAQRIFMFPLAIILLQALLPLDPGVVRYAHRAMAGLTYRPVDELIAALASLD